MKLTYEQYRMLASLGPSNDRIIVKNKKGHVIKPNIKWDLNPKETRYMSSAVHPRQSPVHTASPLEISLHRCCLSHKQRVGKR